MVEKDASKKWIAILVLGTWAPDSAWTLDGSLLRMTLETKLEGNVEFSVFKWPGNNLFMLRRKQSAKLFRLVRKKLSENPAARVALFCHSHGGNIALEAVNRPEVDTDRVSLVTFNTPCLYFLRRDPGSFVGGLILHLFLLLALISMLTLYVFFSAFGFADMRQNITGIYIFAIGVTFSILGIIVLNYRNALILVAADWLLRWNKFVSVGVIRKARMLSVNTAGDEVFNFFKLLESIAALPFMLMNKKVVFLANFLAFCVVLDFLANGCSGGGLLGNWLKSLSQFVCAPPLDPGAISAPPPELALVDAVTQEPHLRYTLGVFVLLVSFALTYLMVLVVASLLSNAVFCAWLGLNPITSPFTFFFHRIGVSVIPLTAARLEFYDAAVGGALLNHSVAYGDPHVLVYVMRWLAEDETRFD
ncbi:hypothetical protein [Mesorhizobium sp. 113-3-3]|uniref:hypothetical protein n=1 Tax=Mesorhizobium sp. 113-3-3 TaxID=2744516 RepID=UPI0019278B7A|nr:hypothetical protein [Mesorhizobium sp. 113-3-3]BCG80602.1 hypothetical protein MesoLj113b_41440 [Mesorhizobium sp. 113-3-3]